MPKKTLSEGEEVLLSLIDSGNRMEKMQKMTNVQFEDEILMPLWGELSIVSAMSDVIGECIRRLRGEAPSQLIEDEYVDELFGNKKKENDEKISTTNN